MQLIPMAIGGAQSGAQARNNGQSAGLFGGPGSIDGTAQSFWNLADPANLTGKASSGHILSNIFDPGNMLGQNQAANPNRGLDANGQPTMLPNLGAQSLIPRIPGGVFVSSALNGSRYNNMAALGAGPLFKPSAMPHGGTLPVLGSNGGKGGLQSGAGPVPPVPMAPGGKGGMPGGGSPMPINPELIQRIRLQQGGLR